MPLAKEHSNNKATAAHQAQPTKSRSKAQKEESERGKAHKMRFWPQP